jgi:hypothetical protein
MRSPVVELLWWDGCPSTPKARVELRAALDELGLEAQVRERQIETDEDAERHGFQGSPTILVDGQDVAPEPHEPVGLSCRVYRRRDGRIAPTPDPDDVREALARAAAREEVTTP